MKLIFLGDSFTEGAGIITDLLKKSYIENNKNINDVNFNEIKKSMMWPSLIANELNLNFENRAQGGSGLQNLLNQFFESEYENFNLKRFYIIGMPNLLNGRLMTSKTITNLNHINHNFKTNFFNKNMTIIFNDFINEKIEPKHEYLFIKKFFKREYFHHINIQIFTCLISYLNLHKIPFLFLPTWEETIKKHLLKDDNQNNFIFLFKKNEKENEIEKLYDFFFLQYLKKNIIIKKNWTHLSCLHPDIKSQEIIKNNYIKYIKEELDEIDIFRR